MEKGLQCSESAQRWLAVCQGVRLVLRSQVVITTGNSCAYQCHFSHQGKSLSLSPGTISISVIMAMLSNREWLKKEALTSTEQLILSTLIL